MGEDAGKWLLLPVGRSGWAIRDQAVWGSFLF